MNKPIAKPAEKVPEVVAAPAAEKVAKPAAERTMRVVGVNARTGEAVLEPVEEE